MFFGEVMHVNPDVVVENLVVDENARRKFGVDGKRNEQAGGKLSAKLEVEVLFLVGDCHHITYFGVGEHRLIRNHVALILDVD